jgi:glycosyltransferase involved in cell wall biosynthesis
MIAHSAKMEGLPTAMIESLILGKLIVATDCPTGPREILDDGKAGLLVPVGDAQAMAEAIHRLLSDETLRQQLHSQAEKHHQVFLFESTLNLFKQLI